MPARQRVPADERLYPKRQAADRLGVSISTLKRMVQDGQLRTVRVRGRALVPKSAVDEILAGGGDR